MKVAIITTHVGIDGTLASTAFIGALADGFIRLGVQTRVVGLALTSDKWRPQLLGPCDASAPWVSPSRPLFSDRLAAVDLGILQKMFLSKKNECFGTQEWYLELLLQRELKNFAGDKNDLTILMYQRSASNLITVMRIAKREGWRVIIFSTEALSPNQIDPATKETYVRCASAGCDGIIAVSKYLADFWKNNGISEKRILINATVLREKSFITRPPARRSSAVYIGNLMHREIDYLIDICVKVNQMLSDFSLTIYCDAIHDQRANLLRMVHARGLADIVSIEGPIPPKDVPMALLNADVLILPRSRAEFSNAGFPNKLGEYLATGRPVVVTSVGDIPDYLVDEESAFLVEPDDCEAFANRLYRALTEHNLADRVGENGRMVAHRLFDSILVADRILTFINNIVPRPQEKAIQSGIERRFKEVPSLELPLRIFQLFQLSLTEMGYLGGLSWRGKLKAITKRLLI